MGPPLSLSLTKTLPISRLAISSIRPCVVVNQYNALIMGRFATRVIPVSMGHYSIKWCSGALFQ
ncbi:hypothetical protein Hanom_Chr11g01021161 [Helianthus anomalus]